MKILVPAQIMRSIFDACDRHADAETGGRLLGFYAGAGSDLSVEVKALIGPGPNARRSRTSFFQDGEWQEIIFRAVERQHPQIAHLGNWHTHHPNGLATLSDGDHQTYKRVVNHQNHAQNFFYALLVTRKLPDPIRRYDFRHYLLFRDDENLYSPRVEIGGNILELGMLRAAKNMR